MRIVRDDSGERNGWWIGETFIPAEAMAELAAGWAMEQVRAGNIGIPRPVEGEK